MMSTALACVVLSVEYDKHLPGDELKGTSGSKCTLKTANTALS